VRAQLPGARRREHAHPPALRHPRAEGEVPPPAVRRLPALVLRHDGARGRGLRPDPDPDAGRQGRRSLGGERPQVVHQRGAARGQNFAILIAKTDPDADPPQARNTAFIVDLPAEGWEVVRDVETMAGGHNHCEIRIENLRVPDSAILGGRGQGHRLGQVRLGPARLAPCMRWIGQVETALEMLVDRATKRFTHGSLLADKQGIQWMVSESAMELYAAKLMVLHAAYLIEHGKPFNTEVSMCKFHVANTLWRT